MQVPTVVLLESWPQPHSVAEALTFATETELALRYLTGGGRQTVLVHFPLVNTFRFGAPNEEALGGHPLAKLGLKWSSVHRIDNSPLIAELEKQNSVHPRHSKQRYLENKAHVVFTFQDAMLECVASETGHWAPNIRTIDDAHLAKVAWRELIDQLARDNEAF